MCIDIWYKKFLVRIRILQIRKILNLKKKINKKNEENEWKKK